MKKKLALMLALVLVFSLIATACSSKPDDAAVEPMVMKISHVSAPGSARDLGSLKVEEVVEEMTGGKIDAQVYPASQLGGQRDQVEGVQFGTIEMVIVPTAYLGGTQPLITLLDTPFLLPEDPDQLYELYQSDAIRQLLDTTEEKDIITLAIWQTGYKQYTANKPLTMPSDMEGLKVRVMNSPILFKQAEVLGANPITMDFGETYGALQNKAIDGQENPIDTIYDMKFNEVQTDITLTNHSTLDQLVMVSKMWWETLDKETQDAIIEGVRQGGLVCKEATIELIEKDKALILETGKTAIHEITPEQRMAWKEALVPVQEFARTSQGERGTELYDMIAAEASSITGE